MVLIITNPHAEMLDFIEQVENAPQFHAGEPFYTECGRLHYDVSVLIESAPALLAQTIELLERLGYHYQI
jgi:hypothetical protein